MRDIPDKLADGEPSVSTVDVAAVRKPWEATREDMVVEGDGTAAGEVGE